MKTLLFIILNLIALAGHANDPEALLDKVHELPLGMTKILKGNDDPIVLVHGLEPTHLQVEWIRPITKLIEQEKNVYFYKWDKFKTLKENQMLLVNEIKIILRNAPRMTLVGHSVGGVIALFAHDLLQETHMASRVELHTIASPIFGYDAPALAVLGIPFVGSTTIEIGMGAFKNLKHHKMNSCTHWVNTNCEMDKHACVNKKNFTAQLKVVDMPCGNENIRYFSEETHNSILNKVFESII